MEHSFECDICSNEYLETDDIIPLILTGCGHTICKVCAVRLKDASRRGSVILCPYCNVKTVIEKNNVMTLKKNFALIQILNSTKSLNNSKEPLPACPEPLKNESVKCAEDPRHTATLYCSTCTLQFCEKCWKRIHRLQVFSGHSKVPISEKPPMCASHKTKIADLYCKSIECKEKSRLICIECLITGIHAGHEIGNVPKTLHEYRQHIQLAQETTEWNTKALTVNMTEIERIMVTYRQNHPEYRKKEKMIDDHFKELRLQLHKESQKAMKNLEAVARARIEKLRILYDDQEAKLRQEVSKANEIIHLVNQDAGEFVVNSQRARSLAKRVVDVKCPPLLDPMNNLQVHLPSLNLTPTEVRPIFRLIEGKMGTEALLKKTDVFSQFIEENGDPLNDAEERINKRYQYNNSVIEMIDPEDECGETLRSMVYAEVTLETIKSLGFLIAYQSPKFELIVIGVLAFEGIEEAVMQLETHFLKNPVRFTIVRDKEQAIKQIVDFTITL